MQTLRHQFMALSLQQKRSVHLDLCEHALKQWKSYVQSRGKITYVDGVCGTRQVVNAGLPNDAVESVMRGCNIADVEQRYLEPITAMEDFDLEFPDHIEFAYYSIYNLFKKYGVQANVDDWLIVNQALSSEADQDKWLQLLENAIAKAKS